jgi:hypothetical protein
MCQCIKCSCRGSRCRGSGPVRSSSEAEPRSRGRSALDRDESPLEGVSSPRAGRNPAQGGAQPPSEADPHPRGRPALERGGVLPARPYSPRAKRSSTRGWLGRLSGGAWAREVYLVRAFRFVCVRFYEGKWVFLWLFRGPLWLSPTNV